MKSLSEISERRKVRSTLKRKTPPPDWSPLVDDWSRALACLTGNEAEYDLTKKQRPKEHARHLSHYAKQLWPIVRDDAKLEQLDLTRMEGKFEFSNQSTSVLSGYLLYRWDFLTIWINSLRLGRGTNALPTMAVHLRDRLPLLNAADRFNDIELFQRATYFRHRTKPAKKPIPYRLFILRYWMAWGLWDRTHDERVNLITQRLNLSPSLRPSKSCVRRIISQFKLIP